MFFEEKTHGAVDQLLNSTFFQNPAELSLINHLQLIEGNTLIASTLGFTGTTTLGSGNASSKAHAYLPYLLTAYRCTDRFVLGVNITPSAYGHLDWPVNSIVAESSTVTNLLYYRIGAQSSYQFTDDLAIGVGINLAYNKLAELDFVVHNQGNQINKVNGLNHTVDLGFFYKINPRNSLTMAVYTPVNTFGHGTSSLGSTTVTNFSLNIIEASVAYIGLQHVISDKWFAEGKLYWSGWSVEKTVSFINKTDGSSRSPVNWKDVWSLQASTRYATTDKVALLGSIIYETNAAPTTTNQIGYPLAAVGSLSAGLDFTFKKAFSSQLLYGYGMFIPNAKINNAGGKGLISANFQAVVLQFTYKA